VGAAVEDAGVGFRPTAASGGFGLLALRERLGQLGGTLAIDPGPGGVGSRVVASVPLTTRAGLGGGASS
jgi:signal transduction histidine kinase